MEEEAESGAMPGIAACMARQPETGAGEQGTGLRRTYEMVRVRQEDGWVPGPVMCNFSVQGVARPMYWDRSRAAPAGLPLLLAPGLTRDSTRDLPRKGPPV